VWQLKAEEEDTFEIKLPTDGGPRRKPWLLHSLDVKEMTFCGIDVVCTDDVCFTCVHSDNRTRLLRFPLEVWVN
jgi:hypothetical protein